MLSTLMMRPQRRSFICGHTRRVSRIAANSFSSKSSRHTSSVISSKAPVRDVPALFTTISILPNNRIASS